MWQPGLTLADCEKIIIEEAIRVYRGNKTQTATSLGICTNTLNSKLEKYEHQAKEQAERVEQLKRRSDASPNARMEPVPQFTPQQPVSVPERKEV